MSKSGAFTAGEWEKIRKLLASDPASYGLPQRVYGSLVLGSFNIRKLGKLQTGGKHERDEMSFHFLADVCRHFDLLAVQEVMSSTESIHHLRELMGPEYGLIVSDPTGALPGGGGGMPERMAFIYDRSVVRRTELVTDVTYDRFEVLETLVGQFDAIEKEVKAYRKALAEREAAARAAKARGKRSPAKPKLRVPAFLTFARTPFAAGFEAQGHPGSERYRFLAVNAHLFFGDSEEDRQLEGAALVRWMMGKAREAEEDAAAVVLFGDMNLDYDKPSRDLERIAGVVDSLNRGGKKVQTSFPFLFPHPGTRQVGFGGEVFRTNVSLNQTFDQIGIFTTDDRLKKRLATTAQGHAQPDAWGAQPEGPDYGVFNFSELFAQALEGRSYAEVADKRAFKNRYEFRVSDHMPLWYRFPLPQLPHGVNISTRVK